jgi:hypothetical protein
MFDRTNPISRAEHEGEIRSINEALVVQALSEILSGLIKYRAISPGKEEIDLADYNFAPRSRVIGELGITIVNDGFVVQEITDEPLAIFSHNLKIPQDTGEQDVVFGRDVILEKPHYRPLELLLTGMEEISGNVAAVATILSIKYDISDYASSNWKNYIPPKTPVVS